MQRLRAEDPPGLDVVPERAIGDGGELEARLQLALQVGGVLALARRIELAVRARALGGEDRQRVLPGGQRRLLDVRAGVLEPRGIGDRAEHADAQAGQRGRRSGHPDQHLEHERALGHRARHRADVIEAGREREAPVDRHAAVRGLEPRGAAGRRGDADRAAGVGAEADGREAGSERRGAAARGAARDVSGAARVADRPVERVLARHAPGELVQVRLADDHGAGIDEALHRAGRRDRHVIAEERRAVGRAHACRVQEILRRERDAGEPAEPAPSGQRAGVRERAVAVHRDHRVQLGTALDARQAVGHDLLGADVAGAHAARDLSAG